MYVNKKESAWFARSPLRQMKQGNFKNLARESFLKLKKSKDTHIRKRKYLRPIL